MQLGVFGRTSSKRSAHNKLVVFSVLGRSFLYKFIQGLILKPTQLYFLAKPSNVLIILRFLKFNSYFLLKALLDICVVDNINKKGYRFEINYVFWNYIFETRFIVKTFVNLSESIFSLASLYKSADWLEREVWDMFGIRFLLHPNLRRLLTDYGFKGYPLRKDFPLSGYINIYYDDSLQSIMAQYLDSSQLFRFYKFQNPWYKWY